MAETKDWARRSLWAVDLISIGLPVLSVLALLAGALANAEPVSQFAYRMVLGEIFVAPYLCLGCLVAFVVSVRLKENGAAAYAVYGLLLNAMGLWLAMTPTFAA